MHLIQVPFTNKALIKYKRTVNTKHIFKIFDYLLDFYRTNKQKQKQTNNEKDI